MCRGFNIATGGCVLSTKRTKVHTVYVPAYARAFISLGASEPESCSAPCVCFLKIRSWIFHRETLFTFRRYYSLSIYKKKKSWKRVKIVSLYSYTEERERKSEVGSKRSSLKFTRYYLFDIHYFLRINTTILLVFIGLVDFTRTILVFLFFCIKWEAVIELKFRENEI